MDGQYGRNACFDFPFFITGLDSSDWIVCVRIYLSGYLEGGFALFTWLATRVTSLDVLLVREPQALSSAYNFTRKMQNE